MYNLISDSSYGLFMKALDPTDVFHYIVLYKLQRLFLGFRSNRLHLLNPMNVFGSALVYLSTFLMRLYEPFKDEAQTVLFKDPVRTAL